MNNQTIVFIGISGAGKGTQATLLKDYLKKNDDTKVHHIETGSLFRDFVQKETYPAQLSKKISQSGNLQPDFLAIWLWGKAILENVEEEGEHLIIDGTPRRVSEAHMLLSAFDFLQRQNITVIYLNVSKEEALDRLKKRKRSDDLDFDVVMNRFSFFAKEVIPTLDVFKKKKNISFLDINGEGTVEKIHDEIVMHLENGSKDNEE